MKGKIKIWSYPLVLLGMLLFLSNCSKKTEYTDPNLSSMVWEKQNSGTDQNLYSVHFPSRDTGYAVGHNDTNHKGLILKTTNGGTTWIPVYMPDSTWFFSVQFLDVNTGYAVGNKICKTMDGGKTWMNQTHPGPQCWLNDICFTDRNTGYLAGGIQYSILSGKQPLLFKTLDGGITWDLQFMGDFGYSFFNSVFFKDADTGYAGGGDLFLETTDRGTNWIDISTIFPSGIAILAGCFADNNTGYMVGGSILKTNDGGRYWTYQHPPRASLGDGYYSVYFTDINRGYVVGSAIRVGLILETSDGGVTWKFQTLNNTGTLRSVFFSDGNTGYAVGDGGVILKTTGK